MNQLKEYSLDELYAIDSGINTKPPQAGHGTPFVSFRTIFNNPILPEVLPDQMDTSAEEQEHYSVKEGDIFLTRTSETLDELAMSSVALKDYPHATFSGFAKRLRPIQNNITYPKFMAFFLRSKYFRKIINCKAIMTLRASFNEEIFSYIKVCLPKYEHQVKSGDLFWAVEKKIRNNNKICAELESMARTIYDYWFLQFEFPNEEGKPYKSSGGKMVWNDELKQEIPEGWKTRKMKDFADVATGKEDANHSVENGKYPFFTCADEILDCDDYKFDGKAILIAGNGSFNVKYYEGKFNAYQRTYVLIPSNESKVGLIHQSTLREIEKFKRGSNGSIVKFITKKDVEEIPILSPSNNVNIQIFNDILNSIQKNNKETQELTVLRDFLLPLLMNEQVVFKDE